MSKKTENQPELLMETPAIVTPGEPGDPSAEKLELIDDTPDVVKMDLRKFNKTHRKISTAVTNITSITIIESQVGVDKMMLVLKEADGVAKEVEAKRKELGDPYRLEVERINKYVKDLVKGVEPAIKGGKAKILAFHKAEEQKAKDKLLIDRIEVLLSLGMIYYPEGDESIRLPHYRHANGTVVLDEKLSIITPEGWLICLNDFAERQAAITRKEVEQLQAQKEGADFFGETDTAAAIDQQIAEVRTAPRAIASYVGFSSAAPATKGLTKRWAFEITDGSQVPREYLQVDEKKVKEAITAGTRAIPGIRIYQDESISLR